MLNRDRDNGDAHGNRPARIAGTLLKLGTATMLGRTAYCRRTSEFDRNGRLA
jgi:hypothetical protein